MKLRKTTMYLRQMRASMTPIWRKYMVVFRSFMGWASGGGGVKLEFVAHAPDGF